MGRFLSEDPIGEGEQSAYAYVDNRPSTLTDPSGLQAATPLGPPTSLYHVCCRDGRMTYCASGNTPLQDKCLDDCAQKHEQGHIKDFCKKGFGDFCKGKPDGPVPRGGPTGIPEKVVNWSECRQYKAVWKCIKKCAESPEKTLFRREMGVRIWEECGKGPRPPF
jgi:hypothetical protein